MTVEITDGNINAPITYQFDFTVVPEPTTFALTALGLLGIGWRRRKRA
ncbi:MAG: PEP-CTERM sorting domain-containing protein [Planctomycetes bacterium]|nr:PEP-CTERM sorting domain-containing protein [Planctomycetota bacterium]